MQSAGELSSIRESLGNVGLLADAFQSGGTLLAEFEKDGHDVTPVARMLEGFAEELLSLLHRLPVEAPGLLFERVQEVRANGLASEWIDLSRKVGQFFEVAQRGCFHSYSA